VPRRPPGLSLGFGSLTNAASAGNGRNEFEDHYDRRTKTILEVRGRENLVLIGVRFSSPAIVLRSSSFSFSFLHCLQKRGCGRT
jgi:hypothetical protein